MKRGRTRRCAPSLFPCTRCLALAQMPAMQSVIATGPLFPQPIVGMRSGHVLRSASMPGLSNSNARPHGTGDRQAEQWSFRLPAPSNGGCRDNRKGGFGGNQRSSAVDSKSPSLSVCCNCDKILPARAPLPNRTRRRHSRFRTAQCASRVGCPGAQMPFSLAKTGVVAYILYLSYKCRAGKHFRQSRGGKPGLQQVSRTRVENDKRYETDQVLRRQPRP